MNGKHLILVALLVSSGYIYFSIEDINRQFLLTSHHSTPTEITEVQAVVSREKEETPHSNGEKAEVEHYIEELSVIREKIDAIEIKENVEPPKRVEIQVETVKETHLEKPPIIEKNPSPQPKERKIEPKVAVESTKIEESDHLESEIEAALKEMSQLNITNE